LLRYAVRRLLVTVPVILVVSLTTFLLIHVVAGNFVPGLKLNPHLSVADIDRIRTNLGLDQPLYQQYLTWLSQIATGNFGHSLVDGTPVSMLIADHIGATLVLVGTALVFGLLVAIPLGVLQAVRSNTVFDQVASAGTAFGYSIPQFWLALMAILLFSVAFRQWGLPALPSSGDQSPFDGSLPDRLWHLIMPAGVLSLAYIATWSRYVRSSMLEVLSSDYVRTARAKGMRELRVLGVHALRNALLPLITMVSLELPALFSGAAVVEIVFGWPGIGQLAFNRALQYDYTTVMGLTTFVAIFVLLANFLADVAYTVANPRIRYR
jgi:peptide/nickel transport system permease protein